MKENTIVHSVKVCSVHTQSVIDFDKSFFVTTAVKNNLNRSVLVATE